jgi:ABC-type uncharacterized transport system involved in gliding motility auxiliary subunit
MLHVEANISPNGGKYKNTGKVSKPAINAFWHRYVLHKNGKNRAILIQNT